MTEELKQELISAIEAFAISATTLSRIWSENEAEIDDALTNKFPFEESFDEAVVKILDWKDQAIDNINAL